MCWSCLFTATYSPITSSVLFNTQWSLHSAGLSASIQQRSRHPADFSHSPSLNMSRWLKDVYTYTQSSFKQNVNKTTVELLRLNPKCPLNRAGNPCSTLYMAYTESESQYWNASHSDVYKHVFQIIIILMLPTFHLIWPVNQFYSILAYCFHFVFLALDIDAV